MDFMVEAKTASFAYPIIDDNGNEVGAQQAVDQVTLAVKRGEFVAILGRNGSGKSTFARMINALYLPSEGKVWTGSYDTTDESRVWDIRKSAGMVFQNPDNQIVASVVEEDVAFGPENLGFLPERIRSNVSQSLANMNMTDYRKASPNRLSGGQKQRVAVSGILAMEPDCIIFDEPTAMLDPHGRQEVMEAIDYLNHEKKITILYITHHMDEAAKADRIIVMDHGHEIMEGTPREIFTHVDELKQLGLDVPQATELAQRLRRRGIPVPADIMTMEEMRDALCQLK